MDKVKQTLHDFIQNIKSYEKWHKKLNDLKDNKIKGNLFEYFCYYILLIHPYYNFDNVYLYDFIPNTLIKSLKLPPKDKGIDILAIKNGKYYGIQCKWRSNRHNIIPWGELSTFPALCFKAKLNYGMFITNCYEVCDDLMHTDHIINVCGDFWDTIDNDFMKKLRLYIKMNAIINDPYKELPHQEIITNEAEEYFVIDENTKGILSMACGTGKSLQAWFIKERLKCNRTIVVVPSLLLLSQIYLEWSKQDTLKALLIGSSADNEIKETHGLILTTETDVIKKWLLDNKDNYTVFTTYQSSDILKDAINKNKIDVDLCIFDEAHNTATSENSIFGVMVGDDFKVKYKLFMTATPKVYKGARDDVYCMDNAEVYGNTIYELTMRDAIEKKLLCDYQIVTSVVSNEQIEAFINMNKYVINGKKTYDSHTLASAIMLLNLMKDKKTVRKVLTYHSYATTKQKKNIVTQSAESFCNLLQELITLMKLDIEVDWLDGTFPMPKRKKILDQLQFSKKQSIVCSAKVLNEGINIKCVDSVMFVSPKKSVKDVIQCTGRALRLYEGKLMANVIIPIIIDNEPESNVKSESFISMWDIIRAIGTQDDVIVEYFKEMSTNRVNNTKFNWMIHTLNDIIPEVKIDIDKWMSDISYSCWKRLDNFDVKFEEFKLWVENHNKLPCTISLDETEHSLGHWASNLRHKRKIGMLSDKRIDCLNTFKKWYWGSDTKKEIAHYDDTYEQVKKWVAINNQLPSYGSSNEIEKKLYIWICNKRVFKKKDY
jgi:predicted helicase